jgi:hypothetical protein
MFSVIGVVLTLFGLVGDKAIYQRSLGINVNFDWGVVMILFGGVMLGLAVRAHNRPQTSGKASH